MERARQREITDLVGIVFSSSSSFCSFCSTGDALSMFKSQSAGWARGTKFYISSIYIFIYWNNNDENNNNHKHLRGMIPFFIFYYWCFNHIKAKLIKLLLAKLRETFSRNLPSQVELWRHFYLTPLNVPFNTTECTIQHYWMDHVILLNGPCNTPECTM